MIEQAIKLPIAIAVKHCQYFKFVAPAIMLPDHTPVSGNGIATNKLNNKSFLTVVCFKESFVKFLLYLDWIKPVINLFLIFLVKIITGKHGIRLPTKAHRKAAQAGKTLFSSIETDNAKGMAILPSNPGINAIKITARKTYSPK